MHRLDQWPGFFGDHAPPPGLGPCARAGQGLLAGTLFFFLLTFFFLCSLFFLVAGEGLTAAVMVNGGLGKPFLRNKWGMLLTVSPLKSTITPYYSRALQ